MKKTLFTLFILLVTGSVLYAQTIPVTFRVKMGARVFNKVWDPAADSVCVRGDFGVDAGGSDWSGWGFKLSGTLTDTIYSITVNLPSAKIGTKYHYKFVSTGDAWESHVVDNDGGNRYFTLDLSAMTLPAYWFNDDSTHVNAAIVTNTVNFNVDISTLAATGFDGSKDSIMVMGLNWDGNGQCLSPDADRKLVENFLVAGQYTTSLQIKGALGDSLRWKYKGYPDPAFTNNGWEDPNRYVTLKADGSTIDLPAVKPLLSMAQPGLNTALDILFECNIKTNPAAVNFKNKRPIPVDSVTFMGIKGGCAPLGQWGGGWVATDTSTPGATLLLMYDDGTHGDKVAGDKVFSRTITFPAGTATGVIPFKFAAIYPTWSIDGAGSLDNEMDMGINHTFTLTQTGPLHLRNDFGNQLADVKDVKGLKADKYALLQNYPNPFNPTTAIRFSLPVAGNVVLKVYNVLGKEVATLLNGFEKAGGKEVSFDASNLPSGMYIYTIKSGNFTSSKKMMLLK